MKSRTCAFVRLGVLGLVLPCTGQAQPRPTDAYLADPSTVKAAREEFARATQGKPYVSPLAQDAKPPRAAP